MKDILVRIRKVIGDTGLNQSEFGKRIHKTPQYIWKLLNDDTANPSDSVISDICREFSISESWLRTGEGDMYRPVEDETAALVASILDKSNPMFDMLLSAVKTYEKLDNKSRAVIDKFIEELNELNKEKFEQEHLDVSKYPYDRALTEEDERFRMEEVRKHFGD